MELADPAVEETMRTAKDNGRRQFDTFVNECILETSHRNKLPLFNSVTRRPTMGKQQITSLEKGSRGLLSPVH